MSRTGAAATDARKGGRLPQRVGQLFWGSVDRVFARPVTAHSIRGLYVVTLGVGSGVAVVVIGYALTRSLLAGVVVALVSVPILAAVSVASRVGLEVLVVVLRLGDHAAEIAEHAAAIAMNTAAIGSNQPTAKADC